MLSVIHSSDPKDVTIRETQKTCMILVGKSNLEGQPEGLVGGPAGGDDRVEGLEQGHAVGLTLLPLNVPALENQMLKG